MTEIVFQVEEDLNGGFAAAAASASIYTEADTIQELRENVRDAVICRFEDPAERPKIIRLHFVRDEVI
jgi:hypothetical protein